VELWHPWLVAIVNEHAGDDDIDVEVVVAIAGNRKVPHPSGGF
jgi:hypothetical protein